MRHIFIINNSTGKQNASVTVRQELKLLEDSISFRYLAFDTNCPKDEIRLTKLMCDVFSDEKIRFYVCGGSGTLANVISSVTDIKNTEIAFYPSGSTCDFLKCFNGEVEAFKNLENLINGHIVHVDYIKSNKQISGINTFSTGIDVKVTTIFQKIHGLSYISAKLTYIIAAICAVIKFRSKRYRITADNNRIYEGNYMWIIAGNGRYTGGSFYLSKNARVDDGFMNVLMVGSLSLKDRLKAFKYAVSGRMDELGSKKETIRTSSLSIECLSGKCDFNYDGEVIEGNEIYLTCINKGINFVVPDNVTLKE